MAKLEESIASHAEEREKMLIRVRRAEGTALEKEKEVAATMSELMGSIQTLREVRVQLEVLTHERDTAVEQSDHRIAMCKEAHDAEVTRLTTSWEERVADKQHS